MQDPKSELINTINDQMDLFQATIGKNNANVISTTTMIFDTMAKTIMAQYTEIEKLRADNAKLTPKPISKKEIPVESIPDEVTN